MPRKKKYLSHSNLAKRSFQAFHPTVSILYWLSCLNGIPLRIPGPPRHSRTSRPTIHTLQGFFFNATQSDNFINQDEKHAIKIGIPLEIISSFSSFSFSNTSLWRFYWPSLNKWTTLYLWIGINPQYIENRNESIE